MSDEIRTVREMWDIASRAANAAKTDEGYEMVASLMKTNSENLNEFSEHLSAMTFAKLGEFIPPGALAQAMGVGAILATVDNPFGENNGD